MSYPPDPARRGKAKYDAVERRLMRSSVIGLFELNAMLHVQRERATTDEQRASYQEQIDRARAILEIWLGEENAA